MDFSVVICTFTNLLESLNDWTVAIEHKECVVVAYIDFRKAFDSVSHKKLLAKMYYYGICGNVLAWLEHLYSTMHGL